MLPAAHRLTDPPSYRRVLRRGRRRAARTLVVSLLVPDVCEAPLGETRVGLVVSKAVGNAVARNRVKRRLRHLAANRLPDLAPGCEVVVRALPAAAGATSAQLGEDLDRCLAAGAGRDGERGRRPRDAAVTA